MKKSNSETSAWLEKNKHKIQHKHIDGQLTGKERKGVTHPEAGAPLPPGPACSMLRPPGRERSLSHQNRRCALCPVPTAALPDPPPPPPFALPGILSSAGTATSACSLTSSWVQARGAGGRSVVGRLSVPQRPPCTPGLAESGSGHSLTRGLPSQGPDWHLPFAPRTPGGRRPPLWCLQLLHSQFAYVLFTHLVVKDDVTIS